MNGIKLRGTGRCLPNRVLTNEELARSLGNHTSADWIASRTGILERRVCSERENQGQSQGHTDLCISAARMALKRAGIAPEEIGVCIVATVTSDTRTPSTACRMQKALGLSHDTICFDLNAACSGFVYALHVMECLLTVAPKKLGLVIGCEVLSRVVDWTDQSTCILFGDGAGAAVVEWRMNWPSIQAVLGCAGNDDFLRCPNFSDGFLTMNGQQVFKFALEAIPWCMNQVLERQELKIQDVDFFVFHQANARILDRVVRKYKIAPEKYGKNIQAYGNTSAASIPIVLSELEETGRLSSGDKILLVGFGGGLTWGGALIEFA